MIFKQKENPNLPLIILYALIKKKLCMFLVLKFVISFLLYSVLKSTIQGFMAIAKYHFIFHFVRNDDGKFKDCFVSGVYGLASPHQDPKLVLALDRVINGGVSDIFLRLR